MIALTAISRIFTMGDQEVRALNNINLTIAPGEYVSVMGPSGSGKSTLLNLIGLLDQPTSGTYRLENIDVPSLPETDQARVRRERIGFIFQSFHLIPRLTAAENIELPLILDGIPGKGDAVYGKHAGLCLESQAFPDSINKQGRDGWPSVILRPGGIYRHAMVHAFTAAEPPPAPAAR